MLCNYTLDTSVTSILSNKKGTVDNSVSVVFRENLFAGILKLLAYSFGHILKQI